VSELDRLAAACLQPSFPGHVVPEWVARWLERGLGGITLFAYNVRDPAQLAELTAALRAEQPELLGSRPSTAARTRAISRSASSTTWR
jgi:beta-N-acetylhexosaminidase